MVIETDVFWGVTPCLGVNRAISDVSEDRIYLQCHVLRKVNIGAGYGK